MQDIIIGINSLIEMVKGFKTLKDMTDQVELKKFLAKLEVDLAETKSRMAGLIDENTKLKSKIQKLQAVKDEKMLFKNNSYYDGDGNGPYCTACYDSKNKKVRLADNTMDPEIFGDKICPVCDTGYKTK
jgi:regulator of replication initiation timing